MDWRLGSRGRTPAEQVGDPEFKTPLTPKKILPLILKRLFYCSQ
jgi:hypothetical protein